MEQAPFSAHRRGPVTEWALLQLRRRIQSKALPSHPDAGLVPWTKLSPKRPGNAATMALVEIMRNAGIHAEPDVRPASIAGWAGSHLLRSGASIEDVTHTLGCRSLDRAAAIIAYDWRGSS